uniref:G-protein coupled receptors family 1 profile domain-containing protein n=1 Tax=Globodera rostochiensis TaxID=31243 RepID=A0A914HMI8_GLORO
MALNSTAFYFESIRNEVYNKFAEERPSWTLVVFASIYTFVASVGIVMNFLVVFVTIRTKELKGSANKLLALYSLFEMVHQSGHFLFVYTVFSGHYLIEFSIAVRILSPSFFAFGCTTLLLFFTSIDRLLYVLFPLRTAQNDNAIICCVVLPIAGMFGAFYVGSLNLNCGSFDEHLIFGTMTDIGAFVSIQCDNWVQLLYEIVTIILLAAIVIYVLIAILLHFKKAPSNSNSNQFNMRIFRSLFIIVSVNISGYFVMNFYVAIILPYIVLLPMAFWKWNQIISIVLNVSAASNAPILYLSSSEYRKAFRKELKPFIKIFSRNSVQPH